MNGVRRASALLLGALAVGGAWPGAEAADRDGAERQYRIARRLAAERSPEAVAALRRVIELDPEGPLADDAMVNLALQLGAPAWPEALGSIGEPDAATARTLLAAAAAMPGADRAVEARYCRALLLLEPLPGRDESTARLELVSVATMRDAGEWPARARYAGALLEERGGDGERARAAWTRLVIDHPDTAVAVRSSVGLARLQLRDGDAGGAADRLQRAIEAGAPSDLGAEAWRAAAVRRVLNPAGLPGALDTPRLVAPGTGIRSPTRLVPFRDGGVAIGDRKAGSVVRLDATGRVSARWQVPGLSALSADPSERLYGTAADAVVTLETGGATRRIAALGDFAPAAALATDGAGGIWVVDRKGTRVGRVDPGAGNVTTVFDLPDARIAAVAADGGRLLALDSRAGTLWALRAGGSPVRLFATPERAPAIAVGPGGRVAILDARQSAVVFHEADGSPLGSWPAGESGLIKPIEIAIGPDGALHLFDGGNDAWWRSP